MNTTIKFKDLDREQKVLLGRKNTIQRMIKHRMDKLKPLLSEVKVLRKEIDKLEDELDSVKDQIRDFIDNNPLTPKITIIKKIQQKKYNYYYGRITFSNSRKDVQIPIKDLKTISDNIRKKNESRLLSKKTPLYNNSLEFENLLKDHLQGWVLDWWRSEGIMKER